MFNKKLSCLLILITIIFSISAVNALDTGNITDDNALGVDANVSDNNIMNNVDDEYLKVSTVSDFDDLQDKVNDTGDGETLYLETNYKTTDSSNQIIISKSITIDGQNHVIDAPDVKRVFLVEANDVCIKNINFINSRSTGLAGGVISWLANNGTLENCNFTNNSASSAGGAVCWMGDSGNITNCNFEKNNVEYGPAVSLTSGESFDPHVIHIQIVNSEGGALYIGGNDVSVDFCRFYDNVALLNGGAISADLGNNVSISNSKFRNNAAGYHGGAINLNGDNASLSNLKFFFNSPEDLFLNSINSTISNSSFRDESCIESWYDVNYENVTYGIGDFDDLAEEIRLTPKGGTLVLDRDYEFINGSYKGILISKSITIDGAGHTLNGKKLSRIFNITAGNVKIKNVNFINGNALGSYGVHYGGGAIYWSGSNGCVENCNFTDNCLYSFEYDPYGEGQVLVDNEGHVVSVYITRPSGATTSQGGAITWMGNNGKVLNSIFRHNGVGYANDGGAIFWAGANGNILNSEFYDNDAYRGAAIYWKGAGGSISFSKFLNSGICDDGIFWTGKNGNIENSILLSYYGRYVISPYSVNVKADFNFWGDTVDNPNLVDKNPNLNYWILMDYSADKDFVFKGDSFVVNYNFRHVADKSGTIYKLNNGLSSKSGSVKFIANETGILNISYNYHEFTFNVNQYNITPGDFYDLLIKIRNTPEGGVLVLDRNYKFTSGFNKGILISKSITIDGAGHTLDGNQLSRIFNITADNVIIKNVHFKNGNAIGRFFSDIDIGGGAIYWSGDNGYLFNCSFVNNAGYGIEDNPFEYGEIYIDDKGNIMYSYRMMPMGAKTNEGGAIVWSGNKGTVDKCLFKNNGVGYPNSGGAICWKGDFGKVIGSEFYSNNAWSGSAICWVGEHGSISSSNFENNELGSAVMWFAKTGSISDSILLGSYRDALYVYEGKVTAENNWWGDTVNKYNQISKPKSVKKWLLMKYTSNKKMVYAGDEVIINFNLKYLGNSKGVIQKLTSNFPNFNLYLTNGAVVKIVNGTG